jgi:hypothetical protein
VTNFERLIKAHTEATTITTVSVATEKVAEELARELLHDPAVRAELQALVRKHFTATMNNLHRSASRNGKKRR